MAMFRSLPTEGYSLEKIYTLEDPFKGEAVHNLQRKACLTNATAVHHKRNVYYKSNPAFDLNHTVFASVTGLMGIRRRIFKAKLGNLMFWSNKAVEMIERKYGKFENSGEMIVKQPDWANYDQLLNFMKTKCDFSCEHADGSFMDHLYFCRDYCAAHYKNQSPRVLFLHSILGVGTNIFPMKVELESELKSMLTEAEYKQVVAFPSVLRLLNQKQLIDDLVRATKEGKIETLKEITMHRVIDNVPITLSKKEFFIALNFQMIHLLDFLPCTNWSTEINDPLFQVFVELYSLLTESKILDANVQISMEEVKNLSEKDEFGMPLTLGGLISRVAPKSLKRTQIIKGITEYSRAIGHDLKYELAFDREI